MDPIVVIGAIGTIITTVVVAGMNGKWVWGWVYTQMLTTLTKALDDMTEDRDFWKATSLELLGHAKALEKGIKGKK